MSAHKVSSEMGRAFILSTIQTIFNAFAQFDLYEVSN